MAVTPNSVSHLVVKTVRVSSTSFILKFTSAGLSNEDAAGGVCERCGSSTTKKLKNQWMLKMSSYADSLLDGLAETEFWDKIKIAQINWIGSAGTIMMAPVP